MKAINYYVIVDKIKEKPKTIAGLELTENQNDDIRYLKGKVISVGDLAVGINEGDTVTFTGRLTMTDTGEGLSGQTIYIYDYDFTFWFSFRVTFRFWIILRFFWTIFGNFRNISENIKKWEFPTLFRIF